MTFFTGEFSNFKTLALKNKIGISFILFFLIHLLSLVYSENQVAGWRSIESKFSFLAFPIFLPLIFNSGINKNSVFKFLNFLALLYILLSLGNYFYDYFIIKDIYPFMGSKIGFKFTESAKSLHPTYLSFYYLALILFNGNELFKGGSSKKKTFFTLSIISIFSLFVIFLSSKVAFIGLVIIAILLLVKYAKESGKLKQTILIFIGFVLIAVIGIYNSNLRLKFEQTYSELTKTNRTNDMKVQSTGARIWFWKTTTEIIKDHPIIGVGTGDIRDELSKRYKEKEITWIQDKGRDSHQQYLQTFAALGIFGFLSLLAIFFILFQYSLKNKNFILFGFSLLYFIFGFTESMFETQAGIIFFVFFSLYLVSTPTNNYTKTL